VSQWCDLCGFKHFDLKYYRRWTEEYRGRAKVFLSSGKPSLMKQQMDRWTAILERHAQQTVETVGEADRQSAWWAEGADNGPAEG